MAVRSEPLTPTWGHQAQGGTLASLWGRDRAGAGPAAVMPQFAPLHVAWVGGHQVPGLLTPSSLVSDPQLRHWYLEARYHPPDSCGSRSPHMRGWGGLRLAVGRWDTDPGSRSHPAGKSPGFKHACLQADLSPPAVCWAGSHS